jgi:methylmalonyl-CoA mutase N-terminal domain/subunit
MSLNTQRILGNETGLTNTIDPLGGSFFIEKLTHEIEDEAWSYIKTIEDLGSGNNLLDGMFAAIGNGYIEREISDASYEYQERIESGEYPVLGLNEPDLEAVPPPALYEHDNEEEVRQIERLEAVIKGRDSNSTERALESVRQAARNSDNTMPFILDAARAEATEGEIMTALRDVFGDYEDPAVF